MAGIFGYLKKSSAYDPAKIKQVLINHALQGFKYSTGYKSDEGTSSGIGFAAPHYDASWPVVSSDNNFLFQLFGEIYLPDSSILKPANFDEKFLKPFLHKRESFLTTLDGGFVFALIDIQKQKIYLCSDPFGNFQLYYYCDSDLILFSSQIHSIASILKTAQWDEKGFYEYLGLGYSLVGKTYYKDIYCLNTAELIELGFAQKKTAKYFKFDYTPGTVIEKDLENISKHIVTSIKRRLDNYKSVGAAITGGFDSRVTWGIINSLNTNCRLTAFTHGMTESRDMKISGKLVNYLNLNHKKLFFDETFISRLPELWEPFTRYTEGLGTITSAHALKSWELGSQNYELLLDSHGGALYRRQYMKVAEKYFEKNKSLGAQFFTRIKLPLLNLNILKEDILKKSISASIIGLQEYFNTQNQLTRHGDQIDAFYINEVSAHKYAAAGNTQMNWLMLAHPLLNINAVKSVQKFSLKDRANQSVYRYILSQRAPELKKFGLENMGMPAPYFGFTIMRYMPMIYEFLLNKTAAKVNQSLYKKLSLRHYITDYDMFFRINFGSIKDILLRENDTFFELTDKKNLEKLILYAEKNNDYKLSLWSNLITLKLFLDIYHP